MDHIWSWIKDEELDCLLNMGEAEEREVVNFSELFHNSRISVEARVNPNFSIPKNKKIVMLSYMDLKRIFKSVKELNEYLKQNLYKKNTERKIGKNQIIKKRTRFFIVPKNFSETCLKVLDKVTNPKYKIDDLNAIVTKAKAMKMMELKSNAVENKIRKTLSKDKETDTKELTR